LSRVCGDYIRRGIGLTTGFIALQVSYTVTTESLTITTDSHNWVTGPAESVQDPGPPADPAGYQLTLLDSRLNWLLLPWLYRLGSDLIENAALTLLSALAVTK
jgi:hypothetical protein